MLSYRGGPCCLWVAQSEGEHSDNEDSAVHANQSWSIIKGVQMTPRNRKMKREEEQQQLPLNRECSQQSCSVPSGWSRNAL